MAKITPEEAKKRLELSAVFGSKKGAKKSKEVFESSNNDEIEYIQSVGEEESIFMFKTGDSYVLSPADDTLEPVIGEFDEVSNDGIMPPCLVDWLNECDAEIDAYQFEHEDDEEIFDEVSFGAGESPIEMVDLGLSVNWANMNIGANKPEELGNYYAWGEVGTKENYTIAKYKYYVPESITIDSKLPTAIAKTAYDIAYAYDKALCMPTTTQLKELASKCTFTATTVNEVAGFEVKGPNGNTIFIPNSGYKVTSSSYLKTRIYLWGSTSNSANYGQNLMVSSTKTKNIENSRKRAGMCVRPVASGEGTPSKDIKLVDLGLSIKWADMNIGAKVSSDYGTYVSWGEVESKTKYDWPQYKYCTYKAATYISLGDNIAKTEYDVAYKLDKNICMPTKAQFEELINKCTWTKTELNGVAGYDVKGPNRKSIFLPVNGCYSESSTNNYPTSTYYWSSTDYKSTNYQACTLKIAEDGTKSMYAMYRRTGAGIRPVSVNENTNLRKTIQPLIPYKWSQSAPYNNLLPKDALTGKTVVTGCSNTALAMIIAYWGCLDHDGKKYRRGCTKTSAYTKQDGKLKLEALPSIAVFDYDKFNKNTTAELNKNADSKTAIATLMKYIGYVSKASYASNGTGTSVSNSLTAIKSKLRMGSNAKLVYASSGMKEWEETIYQNLAKGWPVFVCGWNSSCNSGHAFICDGYDATTGKFHFNWGWSGSYNGWFVLSTLTPASSKNYSYSKRAIVNICPDYVLGDTNKDGKIDISDLMNIVNNILAGKTTNETDINSDESVSMEDVQLIVDVILGKLKL